LKLEILLFRVQISDLKFQVSDSRSEMEDSKIPLFSNIVQEWEIGHFKSEI